jgi:hypothetical protein
MTLSRDRCHWTLVGAFLGFFRPRRRLLLENLALSQQLAALKRRPTIESPAAFDELFRSCREVSALDGNGL